MYITDTGLQLNHDDFNGRAHFLHGYDGAGSHGTHCAGTIVGSTFGIARKANIYSISTCKGGGCSASAGIKGTSIVQRK